MQATALPPPQKAPGRPSSCAHYPAGRSVSRYSMFASTASRLNESGKYSALAQLAVRLP